jgi:hypothetical protein
VIDANPGVKIQSASASPGIVIEPRAVVEVPMPEPDDGSTGSGVAVHIADAMMGTGDEEVNQVEENLLCGHISGGLTSTTCLDMK